jgi:hypothetical protein
MLPHETDSLLRMMLGMLLFRLGGEQSFTLAEYEYIRKEVGGVQIFADEEGTITLKVRNHAVATKALDEGTAI